MIDSDAIMEVLAMRAVLLAVIALLLMPSVSLAGHHGHLAKLKDHHQQHKFKHQLKKALKDGCDACEEGGHGGHHGHGQHKLFHHHKK
jgi:hypothetical protein